LFLDNSKPKDPFLGNEVYAENRSPPFENLCFLELNGLPMGYSEKMEQFEKGER